MWKKRIVWICGLLLLVGSVLAVLFYNGVLLFNNPSKEDYPIRGVDVSSYQGEIDWNVLMGQEIQFAYIKATEGSSFVDSKFSVNYENAQKTDLRVGAYHFFSFDSEGKTQAQNFISVVNKVDRMLPPVVDIEFYKDKAKNPPEAGETREQLQILLTELETAYGMKPIIYATKESYDRYIADEFKDYGIWIRNIFSKPSLSDHREWVFWQYTNRERLEGYEGDEKYIDVNVFHGTKEQFENL